MRRSFKIGLFIFALTALICFVVCNPTVQRGVFYPFRHRVAVELYSKKYNVDKYLAIAVMKHESGFEPSALSHSGAVGLMQLMPETAEWIATQLDEVPLDDIKRLYEPELNIRYGVWYLADLEKEFDGNDVLALAAYNAGRGNVWHWIELYGWTHDFADIDQIPYSETRDYVRRVLDSRLKYQSFYASEEGG